jgi:hypothetical protein
VKLEGSSYNTVSGNFIGVDVSGTSSMANAEPGIAVRGAHYNQIGGQNTGPLGTCGGECNLVSGSGGSGVEIAEGATHNTVSGNFVGTDISGTNCVYNNQNEAVALFDGAAYNTIGGPSLTERNHLGCEGVTVGNPSSSGSHHNRIINNYMGVDPTDSYRLVGAVWQGILMWEDGSDAEIISNTIRGFRGQGIAIEGNVERVVIRGNVVSHNGGGDWLPQGILVGMFGGGPSGVTISGNSIYSNVGSGIRLGDGANAGIQSPVVAYVNEATGVVTGTACAGCRVEVFSDDNDEGRWYEGVVTATVSGEWSFDGLGPFAGRYVHATATDADGNTSEFGGRIPWAYLPMIVRQ